MRCHYCDRPAVAEPAFDGVRVGLCERHLRDQVDALHRSLVTEAAGLSGED